MLPTTYQKLELEIPIEFLVIDDFISEHNRNDLESFFTSNQFPWLLTTDAISGQSGSKNTVGFYHTFFYDEKILSPFYHKLDTLIDSFKYINLDIKKLFRCRAGLFLNDNKGRNHECHVDAAFEHITAVYYVTDSDGDLIIHNETVKQYPFVKPEILSTKHSVRPKKGKLVVFDGCHYHSTSYPCMHDLRIAITLNFYK